MSARAARRRAKLPDMRFVTKPAVMALRWTRTLLQVDIRGADGVCLPLSRTFTARRGARGPRLTLRCDASPWGFGGLLEREDKVVAYWADEITSLDRRVCPGAAGDPAFQAE